MKPSLLWPLSLAFAGSLAAQSTIQLEDGRTLERARVIRQSAATVTFSHAGGIVQVEKDQLPPELRARYPITAAPPVALPVAPAGAPAAEPPRPVAPPAAPDPVSPSPEQAAPASVPAPAPPREPAPPPPPAAPVAPYPTITVTATYLWRDSPGGATPLTEVRGFVAERSTFLDWGARRRERFGAAGRRMLLEFVRTEGQAARDAARERLEEYVAKSVAEPPAAATRLAVNEHGQFSLTAPAGRPIVIVMTATRKEEGRTRFLTWFDLIDGTADRRISRDGIESSVGDWSFAE